MSFRRFDRRTFVLGGVALSTLAACGGSEPAGLKPDRLGVRFPDGERAPSVAVVGHGDQRFPFVVIADDGLPMITNTPESIEIDVLLDDEVITTEVVEARGVGQFTPYYPLTFTPPKAGWYVARTSFSDLDTPFLVVERTDTPLFQVGEKLPGFDSPTFDSANGVDPVCTRTEPCPFHEITLAEALTNGKPTALLIATPAFCQTDVCGSNLEFLIDGAAGRADVNVIHAEVYANFAEDIDTGALPRRAPMLEAWDMAFEPSLFAIDGEGTILGARHFAFDREETVEVLGLLS
jgi:hypothetical protein